MRFAVSRLQGYEYDKAVMIEALHVLENRRRAAIIQAYLKGYLVSPTVYKVDFKWVCKKHPNALRLIHNERIGLYDVNNAVLLRYAVARTRVGPDQTFLKVCLEIAELGAYIENLRELLRSTKGLKKRSLLVRIDISQRVRYLSTGALDNRYAVTMHDEVFVYSTRGLMYDYFTERCGIKKANWTFLGMGSREAEYEFIPLLFGGEISPTTKDGKRVLEMFPESSKDGRRYHLEDAALQGTRKKRFELLDSFVRSSRYDILGLSDWDVYYGSYDMTFRKSREGFYLVPFVYNLDTDEVLHDVSKLLGFGGIYTSVEQYEGQRKTPLLDAKGELVWLYMVEDPLFTFEDIFETYVVESLKGTVDETWAYYKHRQNNGLDVESNCTLSLKLEYNIKSLTKVFKRAYPDISRESWAAYIEALYIYF